MLIALLRVRCRMVCFAADVSDATAEVAATVAAMVDAAVPVFIAVAVVVVSMYCCI